MAADGVRGALAVMTSAFSSYSGCRQYREDVERAREAVGAATPPCLKLRVFYNHPAFIEVMRERVAKALEQWPPEQRRLPRILYTAHSVPSAMARLCRYESQLHEAARLVSDAFPANPWELVYQSRSGPPQVPWLEPDVGDRIRALHAAGLRDLVLAPIGFLSDHMEVIYDLDTEARELCDELGVTLVRAGTVDAHPRFVAGLADLVVERLANERQPGAAPRPALGCHGPSHDVCPPDCCLPGERRGR
jgi:ferrochelatase